MKINQGNSQRGAFLILVAFLLPLIMAMLGFVIDFGNVYWHKSVLQNCADASALGGAKVGAGKQFNHKAADEKVAELHDKNKRYASEIKKYQQHNGRYCNSKSNSKVHYYVVTMTEKVPMFFLRYFGYQEMEIEASCIVKIPGGDGGVPLFDNLITYSDKLEVDQSYNKKFWGDIIHTNEAAKASVGGYYKYFSDGHREEQQGDKGELTLTNGKTIQPNDNKFLNEKYDFDLERNIELKNRIDKWKKQANIISTGQSQNITQDMLKTQVTYVSPRYETSSIDIYFNNNFDNNPNSKHIIIVEKGAVNLHFNSDLMSKLIVINLSDQQMSIDGGGHTTHLTVYAPKVENIVWNPNGQKFYGSIVAARVSIKGGGDTFIHESPDLSEVDEGNGEGITLADDEDIVW